MTESRDTAKEKREVRGRVAGKWQKKRRSCWFKETGKGAAANTKQKSVGNRSVQKGDKNKTKQKQRINVHVFRGNIRW